MKQTFTNLFLLLSIIANSQTMQTNKETLVPFCNAENKWGYMNSTTKQVIVNPKYDNAWLENKGVFKVAYYNPDRTDWSKTYIYGILDHEGNELLSCLFTNINTDQIYSSPLPENLIVASNSAGMGVYDIKLKNWIVPQDFIKDGKISFFGKDGILCNKTVFFFEGKKYEVPKGYEVQWVDMKNQWFPIIKDELKKGIAKWNGEIIIPANYSNVRSAGKTVKRIIAHKPDFDLSGPGSYLKLMVKLRNGDREKKDMSISEIFDTDGKLLKTIKAKYEIFSEDGSDKASFTQNGIDKEIDLVTLEITDIDFNTKKSDDDIVAFKVKDKWGLKDTEGKIIIAPQYKNIKDLNKDFFIAQDNTYRYGIIDLNNQILTPFIYNEIYQASNPDCEYIFCALKDNKYGAINAKGQIVVAFKYDNSFFFDDAGFAYVNYISRSKEEGKDVFKSNKGIIDTTGKEIVPVIYNYVGNTKKIDGAENVKYIVENNNLYGLLDTSGKILLPLQYSFFQDTRKSFDDEWINIKEYGGERASVYNMKTGILVESKSKGISAYENLIVSAIIVDDQVKFCFLDLKGNILPNSIYDKIKSDGDFFIVNRNLKTGLLDKNGKEILPLIYHSLEFKTSEFLLATKDGKKFYVDVTGKEYTANIIKK